MGLKGVFYTDGGCKAAHGKSTGKIGWGVHGYIYDNTVIKPVSINDHVVTNMGYVHKQKTSEFGQYIEPIYCIEGIGSSLDAATNNVAELLGVIELLKKIIEFKLEHFLIITDSEYVKKGINEWLPNWIKNDWVKPDGRKVANRERWEEIHAYLTDFDNKAITYNVDWIRSHDDNEGNIQADILASIGCNYSINNQLINLFTTMEWREYSKYTLYKHPFINFKRVYFNSFMSFNVPGTYYQADPGGNDLIIGKRLPETGYSVIRLKEPDSIVESIKTMQNKVARGYNGIFMIKLDNAYSKAISKYILDYKDYALTKSRRNNNLTFVDDVLTPITTEINPTGLSLRAIDSFNFLEEILDKYIYYTTTPSNSNDDAFQIQLVDITSTFFNEVIKKDTVSKELKPEIGVSFKDIKIPITRNDKNINIVLLMGLDILARNNLKKIEKLNPKVTLVVFSETALSIRYCTVIECDDAIGIWSNFYADKLFI